MKKQIRITMSVLMMAYSLYMPNILGQALAQVTGGSETSSKVSTSVSNALILGDISLGYEKMIRPNISVVSSAHCMPIHKDGHSNLFKHPSVRGTLGLRSYSQFNFWGLMRPVGKDFGSYIQLSTGVNLVEDQVVPSIEFWMGHARPLNEWVFLDSGIGLGRLLTKNSIGDVAPLFNIGLGIKL